MDRLQQLHNRATSAKHSSYLGYGSVLGGGLLACLLGFSSGDRNIQRQFVGTGLSLAIGGSAVLALLDKCNTGKVCLPFTRYQLGEWLEDAPGRNYPEWIDYLPEGLQGEAVSLWQSQPKQPTPPPPAVTELVTPSAPAAAAMPSPPPAVTDSISPPAVSSGWDRTQWEVWNHIVTDCPDLRLVLMANLVVISGVQQGGKSTLASIIGRLRGYLLGYRQISVSPHKDGHKIFGGEVIGHGGNFEAIARWYQGMVDGFEVHPSITTSLLVDELTDYVDDWEKLGQDIVRTALSKSVKHGYRVILVNHAQTVSNGFANIKGAKQLIESSAVQILRSYAYRPDGSQGINPTIEVTLPSLGTRQITLPDWLNLDFLKVVSMPPQANSNPTVTAPVQTVQNPVQTVEPTNLVQFRLNRDELLNHSSSGRFSGSVQFSSTVQGRFTPQNWDAAYTLNRITELHGQGLNQTQVIETLWQCKKGGSTAYQTAVQEYKILTNSNSYVG